MSDLFKRIGNFFWKVLLYPVDDYYLGDCKDE
jgi:hypothetical protein